VQAPDFTQGFNRYSYCLNNPFKYTDPSGEFIESFIFGLAVGMGAYQGQKIANAQGYDFGNWQTYVYMVGGAIIGGASWYLGNTITAGISTAIIANGSSAITASIVSGGISTAATNALYSSVSTAINGGNLGDVFLSFVKGSVIGGFSGAAGGAAFQGVNQILNKTITKSVGENASLLQHLRKIGTTVSSKTTWARLLLTYYLPVNTLSYMAGSTASQMTANLINGKKIFKTDFGLNIGVLLPAFLDIAEYSRSFQNYLAVKNNTLDGIISDVDSFNTTVEPNGDLSSSMSVNYIPRREPFNFHTDGSLIPDTYSEIFNSQLFLNRPSMGEVNIDPLISNYRGLIQYFYFLSINRK
jgi:hypothetical protein